MCLTKSVRLALEGFDRLQALHAERLRNGRAALRGSCPTSTAELDHARTIRESAATMRGKGYAVLVEQESKYAPITKLQVVGPACTTFVGEHLRELLEECPPYARVDDYALAIQEQYQE